ncbi:MAG TPA: TetR/AcrR family transcriptional regulator, partial [Clostridiales bacterium]|nr:TetR/AcrR family transcriptional regulator [Clostridiales bacterium]
VLSAMLIAIAQKDKILSNPIEVFEFMIDNLIDKIFE